MLLACGLLFVIGSIQPEPEPLARQVIEGKCLPLSRLGEALEVKVTIPGSLKGQIIFLRTAGAKPEESLEMVSESLGCILEKSVGEWRMIKTPASSAADLASDRLLREKAYTALFQDFKERKAGSPTDWLKKLTEADDDGYLDTSFIPSAWLVRELLYKLGPKELAKIEPYTPRIWSLHPTLAELPLPMSAAELVRQYEDFNRTLGQLMELAPDKRWQSRLINTSVSQAIYPKAVRHVRLIGGLWLPRFRASVMLFDADGKMIDLGSTDEVIAGLPSLDLKLDPDFAGDKKLIPRDQLPSVNAYKVKQEEPLPRELAEKAVVELSEEPLDASAGEYLAAAGHLLGKGVCAPLPDSLHQAIMAAPPATSEELFRLLADHWVIFQQKEGWLLGRLGYRKSWLGRLNLDRPQMKKWLAKGRSEGMEWLREEFLLASASQDGIYGNSLTNWWRKAVLSPLRSTPLTFMPNINLQMQRALGGLSESDWSRAARGEPAEVRPGSKVAALIHESTVGYLALSMKAGPDLSDWAKSGSVTLERGVPAGTTLSFVLGASKYVLNSRWGKHSMPLENLAGNIVSQISEISEPAVNNYVTGPHTIATKGSLSIIVDFGQGVIFERSLDLEGVTPVKEGIHFIDWPQDWKDILMKDLKELKQYHRGGSSGRPPQ